MTLNLPLIGELIALRYKLLWAHTRSRNGRILLFFAGYILLALLVAALTTGGFSAAMLLVQKGQGEIIARAVLSAIFLQAVLAANAMGFGMNAIFSDVELRRYPLNAADRKIARHVIGIVDPFWFLFLALEIGLAVGLYSLGGSNFWFGIIAVLLLLICNYLLARVVAQIIDHLLKRKGGTIILVGIIIVFVFVPLVVSSFYRRNPAILAARLEQLKGMPSLMQFFQYTPPFAAAAAMTRDDWPAILGLLVLLGWTIGLVALLMWLEKYPPQRQTSESIAISWTSIYDRIGAWFGPILGPFVGHWLQFYARNGRTRIMFLISPILFSFITFNSSRRFGADGLFIAALGTFPMMTFMPTARIAVNQFGYVGGAFRRYFLLPTNPALTLRAASYASLLLGLPVLPVAILIFAILAPKPLDPRMLLMLFCSGIAGLLLLNAAGIWVTLFNPRRGKYNATFGNDLSLGGNIVVIGGILAALIIPGTLRDSWPSALSPGGWWLWLPLPLIAAALYAVTLIAAGPIFTARREQLLATIEGKD